MSSISKANSKKKNRLKNLTAMRKKNREKKVVKIEKVASRNEMTVLGVQRKKLIGNENMSDVEKKKIGSNTNGLLNTKNESLSASHSSPAQTFKIVADPFKVNIGIGWDLENDHGEGKKKVRTNSKDLEENFPTPEEVNLKKNIPSKSSNHIQNNNRGAAAQADKDGSTLSRFSLSKTSNGRDLNSRYHNNQKRKQFKTGVKNIWNSSPAKYRSNNMYYDSKDPKSNANISNDNHTKHHPHKTRGYYETNNNSKNKNNNNDNSLVGRRMMRDNVYRDNVYGKHYYENDDYYNDNDFKRYQTGKDTFDDSAASYHWRNRRLNNGNVRNNVGTGMRNEASQNNSKPQHAGQLNHVHDDNGDGVIVDEYANRNVQGKKIFDPTTGEMVDASGMNVVKAFKAVNVAVDEALKNNDKSDNYKDDNNNARHRRGRNYQRRYGRFKRDNIVDEVEEKNRIERKIANSINNVVAPIDAEDSEDDSAMSRTPKILEQLILMNKKKRADKDSRKSSRKKNNKCKSNSSSSSSSSNSSSSTVSKRRKKQIYDPTSGKMQGVHNNRGSTTTNTKHKKKLTNKEREPANKEREKTNNTSNSDKKCSKDSSKNTSKNNTKRNSKSKTKNVESKKKDGNENKAKKLKKTKIKKNNKAVGVNTSAKNLANINNVVEKNAMPRNHKAAPAQTKAADAERNKLVDKKHNDVKREDLLQEQARLVELKKTVAQHAKEAEEKNVEDNQDNNIYEGETGSATIGVGDDHGKDQKVVPENLLKVWGERNNGTLDDNFSNRVSVSPSSWEPGHQSTWGTPTGGYFDALFANTSGSANAITSSDNLQQEVYQNDRFDNINNHSNKSYLNIHQQGYFSSINTMMGNAELNSIMAVNEQQNGNATFATFRNSMLGISTSRSDDNTLQEENDINDDDNSTNNNNFDETKLIGSFLDSPLIAPKQDASKQKLDEKLDL